MAVRRGIILFAVCILSSVASAESENGTNGELNLDSQPLAQVNVFQLYVIPVQRKKRLRSFDHLPGCPNDAIQFVKTTNFDQSLKRHVFRAAFAVSMEECANLCHTHFFCRSAGYEPFSHRCLLSYKRSVVTCDWSAATNDEPSLSDVIRTSDWWLGKTKDEDDDNGYDSALEEYNDVWLDCDQCKYGPKYSERNGTNITVLSINGSLKNESEIGADNISSADSFLHQLNASAFSDALNVTLFNTTSGNETYHPISALHRNETILNATSANETATANTLNISKLAIGIQSVDSINETLILFNDNETGVNATRHLNASSIAGNTTVEFSTTGNITLRSPVNLTLENASLHSGFNLSLGNGTLHPDQSLENSSRYQNLTSENLLNLTSESAAHQNLTLANTTDLTSGNSSLHANLTLDNATLHSNQSLDNGTVHSNLTIDADNLYHILFNLTLDNVTGPNTSLENGNHTSFNLSFTNVTEGDRDKASVRGLTNSTIGHPQLPAIDQVSSTTSGAPSVESSTESFVVTTRRSRKFTRRPFTRHVEFVGNFSSPAGAFVGGDVEEDI